MIQYPQKQRARYSKTGLQKQKLTAQEIYDYLHALWVGETIPPDIYILDAPDGTPWNDWKAHTVGSIWIKDQGKGRSVYTLIITREERSVHGGLLALILRTEQERTFRFNGFFLAQHIPTLPHLGNYVQNTTRCTQIAPTQVLIHGKPADA